MKGYLLVPLLYFISLLQASLQNACYLSECQHGMLLQDCIHGQWQCLTTEFCEVRIHEHVSTECMGQEHRPLCLDKNANNRPTCDPRAPSSTDCTYCCNDETCMQQLVAAFMRTPLNMKGYLLVSLLYFISLLQASLQNTCYIPQCQHGMLLQDCILGQWQCHSNQFCEVRIHDHVSTQCTGQEHLLQCLDKNAKNSERCDPRATSSTDCTYCCNDETCMQQLAAAPAKHCFTNQCGDHFVDLTDCLGHTWNCDSDEYCEMIIHQADFPSQCNHIPRLEGEARWQMQCQPIHATHSNGNHIGLETCRELSNDCTPGCDPFSNANSCILCATSLEDFESRVRNTTSTLLSTVPSTGQPAQPSSTQAGSSIVGR